MVKGHAESQGRSALALVVPFDELALLQAHKAYLERHLGMPVEIVDVATCTDDKVHPPSPLGSLSPGAICYAVCPAIIGRLCLLVLSARLCLYVCLCVPAWWVRMYPHARLCLCLC